MFDVEVLIQERVSNIDTSSPCTISVLKVTTYKTIKDMKIKKKIKKYNEYK